MKHLLTLTLLCFGLFAQAQIPNYVPTNGLVGWWPFNGNANDESGNGNHGTVNGATLAADRFGNAGKAYSFNNSSIIIPHSTSISTSNFTISAWVKLSTFNGNGFEVLTKGCDLNENYEFLVYGSNVDSGAIETAIKFTDGSRSGTRGSGIPNNCLRRLNSHVWSLLTASYDVNSGYLIFYINGTPNCIDYLNRIPQQNSSPITIGREPCFNGREYFGLIDDIAIYNRALSAAEVQQLYSGQSACNLSVSLSATDTLAACGTPPTLNAGNAGATYAWNTGDSSQTITANTTGWYSVTVSQNGCSATDSVYVNLLQVDLGNDTTVCRNSTVALGMNAFGSQNSISNNLKNGLVAWYGLDGNAFDKSGNGYHGTIEGNPINYSTPNKNYLYFDDYIPVIDRINLPQSLSIQYNNLNQGAISLWLNVDSFIRNNHYFNWDNIFLAKQKDGQNSQLDLGILSGTNKLRFHLNGPFPGANQLISNSSLQQKTWYHVLVQWDGTKMQFFINGKFDNEFLTNITLTNMPNPDYFSIGMCPGVGSWGSFSKIDEVMFYNRTLTNSEINQLFISSSTPTSILWSTGDTTPSITVSPSQTTTYYCTVSDGISTCTDSVTVFVTSPPVLSLPDTLRSNTRPVVLQPGAAAQYAWSTGDTTASLSVNTAGTYSLTAANAAGCSASDTCLVLFSNPAPAVATPAGGRFNYQASVMDLFGKPLANRTLVVRFSISDSSSINYVETHSVTTDARGHFATQVGSGTVAAGSLDNISWWDGLSRALRTDIDTTGSGSWMQLGSGSLVAVPFSMYALRSGDGSRSVYGSFDANGIVVSGRGFSVTPLGNGRFEIEFQHEFNEIPTPLLSANEPLVNWPKIIQLTKKKCIVDAQLTSLQQLAFEFKGR